MTRVGRFEKVSFPQFLEAMTQDRISLPEEEIRKIYDGIQLPSRATSGSAGYDFRSPVAFALSPGASIKIPTGIRVRIEEGWWLGALPRSSLGFKYRLQLDNTMGVIDSDYYHSSNEGHIFIKVTNDGKNGKEVFIEPGDAVAQAIFLPYGITYDDNVTSIRDGGFGSTGR